MKPDYDEINKSLSDAVKEQISMTFTTTTDEEAALCKTCKGRSHVTMRVKNLATLEYTECIVPCPICNGKGHVTEDDRKRIISPEMLEQIIS